MCISVKKKGEKSADAWLETFLDLADFYTFLFYSMQISNTFSSVSVVSFIKFTMYNFCFFKQHLYGSTLSA